MNKKLEMRFLPTLSNTVYRDKMAIADAAVVWDLQRQFKLFLQLNNTKIPIDYSTVLDFATIHQ
jgi:hypothetical protein